MHLEHRPAPVENMNLGQDTIAAFTAFERADEIGLGFGRPAVGAMALRGDGCEGEAGAGEERGG